MFDAAAVTFTNVHGLKLFGTLHTPATPNSALAAVVLLSPGIKMRVGPGRLYLPLTDMLNSMGYAVLRFDFFGLGDSEGELSEPMLTDVYNNIEVGRYVDDSLCALNWLAENHRYDRFIVGGLCGGAITAVLAAQRDPRVIGLLSLGMTVTLASNTATPAKYLPGGQLDLLRRNYFRRLLQPASWLRLLTLRSDYALIWHALRRMVVSRRPASAATGVNGGSAPPEQRGNANPLFPAAFFAFLERGGKALMLFGENDRLQAEYQEKFSEAYADRLRAFLPQLKEHVIPKANHVLSMDEWQHEMLEISRKWFTVVQSV